MINIIQVAPPPLKKKYNNVELYSIWKTIARLNWREQELSRAVHNWEKTRFFCEKCSSNVILLALPYNHWIIPFLVQLNLRVCKVISSSDLQIRSKQGSGLDFRHDFEPFALVPFLFCWTRVFSSRLNAILSQTVAPEAPPDLKL